MTRWLIHYVPQIDNIEIIKSNFIGLAGVDEVKHEEYYGNETLSTKHSKSYVYVKNDSRIEDEVSRLENEHTDGTSLDKFIFWQTALASGYNPKYIPNYNSSNFASDKLERYFTVGALVIVESFIEAIKDALLILILFIIDRVKDKPMFFEDFKALKKYMAEDIYKDEPKSDSFGSSSRYNDY